MNVNTSFSNSSIKMISGEEVRSVDLMILGVLAVLATVVCFLAISVCLQGGLLKDIDGRTKNVDQSLQWLLVATPERVDFWHPRIKNCQALCKRDQNMRQNMINYYGSKSYVRGKNKMRVAKCALTGHTSSTSYCSKVDIAHILPRNSLPMVYSHFGLTTNDRDGPRMGIFLCKHIETAYDERRISFYEKKDENGTPLKMKIWDEDVKEKKLWKPTSKNEVIETIGMYENRTLTFGDGKAPYTRILAYHHQVCYYHALSQGWIQRGDKVPEVYRSPLEKENVPRDIYMNPKNYHSSQSSFCTPTKNSLTNVNSGSTEALTHEEESVSTN